MFLKKHTLIRGINHPSAMPNPERSSKQEAVKELVAASSKRKNCHHFGFIVNEKKTNNDDELKNN